MPVLRFFGVVSGWEFRARTQSSIPEIKDQAASICREFLGDFTALFGATEPGTAPIQLMIVPSWQSPHLGTLYVLLAFQEFDLIFK